MTDEANYKSELVGVFGSPVAENPTIVMQEAGFRALGLNWRYLNIEVYPQELATAIQGLRAFNMQGINLTIPHKVEVLQYLDEVAPDAQLMGAVNTVRRDGDRLIGENTDGKGFLQSLKLDIEIYRPPAQSSYPSVFIGYPQLMGMDSRLRRAGMTRRLALSATSSTPAIRARPRTSPTNGWSASNSASRCWK
jgi:hypothetical protein